MKPSRTPASESTHLATVPIADAPFGGAVLAVRLTIDGNTDRPVWHDGTPAACLATDLIVASGGTPVDSQGSILWARFNAIDSAGLTVRRLQWAAQGFADTAGSGPVNLTALLQTGEDASSGAAAYDLIDRAAPGQILVAEGAGAALQEIPGFLLREGPAGLKELAWRAPDEQATRAFDDRAVKRFIAENNRVSPEEPPPTSGEIKALNAALPSAQFAAPEPVERKKTGLYVGLAAVAVIAAAAGGFFYMRSGSTSTDNTPPVVQQQAQQASAESVTPPPPSHSAAHVPSTEPKAQPENPKPPVPQKEQDRNSRSAKNKTDSPALDSAPKKQDTPAPRGGECQLSADQLPDMLARAESNRARGQYPAARRMFSAVLGCEPGNQKAKEGLQRVKDAMAAEGKSDE